MSTTQKNKEINRYSVNTRSHITPRVRIIGYDVIQDLADILTCDVMMKHEHNSLQLREDKSGDVSPLFPLTQEGYMLAHAWLCTYITA